jgi:hypothetical protein
MRLVLSTADMPDASIWELAEMVTMAVKAVALE